MKRNLSEVDALRRFESDLAKVWPKQTKVLAVTVPTCAVRPASAKSASRRGRVVA